MLHNIKSLFSEKNVITPSSSEQKGTGKVEKQKQMRKSDN